MGVHLFNSGAGRTVCRSFVLVLVGDDRHTGLGLVVHVGLLIELCQPEIVECTYTESLCEVVHQFGVLGIVVYGFDKTVGHVYLLVESTPDKVGEVGCGADVGKHSL